MSDSKLTDQERNTMYDASGLPDTPIANTIKPGLTPDNKDERRISYLLIKIQSLESTITTLHQKIRDQATRISNVEQQVRKISTKIK